jgi:hypothetical protein
VRGGEVVVDVHEDRTRQVAGVVDRPAGASVEVPADVGEDDVPADQPGPIDDGRDGSGHALGA